MNVTKKRNLYRHDGPGGPVRAVSASHAARILARRLFGCAGCVRNVALSARRWTPYDVGGGKITAKAWNVIVARMGDERERMFNVRQPSVEIRVTEGGFVPLFTPKTGWKTTRRRPADLLPSACGVRMASTFRSVASRVMDVALQKEVRI